MSTTEHPTRLRPLLRPADAASTLGISMSTLRRLTASGRLVPVRISERRLGYRPADLEALIEPRTRDLAPPHRKPRRRAPERIARFIAGSRRKAR